jgi:hypothetical protein
MPAGISTSIELEEATRMISRSPAETPSRRSRAD